MINCEQKGNIFVITSTAKKEAKAFIAFISEKNKWRVSFYHTRGNSYFFENYPQCLEFVKARGYK